MKRAMRAPIDHASGFSAVSRDSHACHRRLMLRPKAIDSLPSGSEVARASCPWVWVYNTDRPMLLHLCRARPWSMPMSRASERGADQGPALRVKASGDWCDIPTSCGSRQDRDLRTPPAKVKLTSAASVEVALTYSSRKAVVFETLAGIKKRTLGRGRARFEVSIDSRPRFTDNSSLPSAQLAKSAGSARSTKVSLLLIRQLISAPSTANHVVKPCPAPIKSGHSSS
jgi:hypothetical protein